MAKRTFTEAMRSRDNAFDILRLVSATAVLVYHSIALSGNGVGGRAVTGVTLGTLGVLSFFGISGFLITASWLGDPRPRAYIVKRGLRIVPGLVVCAFLTALVLGPIVSRASTGDYFGDPGPYLYVLKQLFLVTFNPFLPATFSDNPVPGVVNGSLWTIPLEACAYLAVLVGGLLGALRHPRVMVVLLAVVVLAMVVAAPADDPDGRTGDTLEALLNSLRPCGAFLAGSCLWVLADRVPRSPLLLAIAIAALFVPVSIELHSAIDVVAVPYIVVVLGTMQQGRARALVRHGDVSYGLYVYAYPIQQTIVQLEPGISSLGLLAASLPLSWLAGLASWKLVERPATGLRSRLGVRPPGPTAAASAAPART